MLTKKKKEGAKFARAQVDFTLTPEQQDSGEEQNDLRAGKEDKVGDKTSEKSGGLALDQSSDSESDIIVPNSNKKRTNPFAQSPQLHVKRAKLEQDNTSNSVT